MKAFRSLPPTPATSDFFPHPEPLEAEDTIDEEDERLATEALKIDLVAFRRASYERQDTQTSLGRVYRKVRLRRSHDQQKLRSKMKREMARKCRSEAGSVCGDIPEWEKENERPMTPPSFAKSSGSMDWKTQMPRQSIVGSSKSHRHHDAPTPSAFRHDA